MAVPRETAPPPPARPRPLAAELVALVRNPVHVYPRLYERHNLAAILFFSAVSGIYVAYAGAERLHLGDRAGFLPTAIGVALVGAALGIIALYFAGGLLSWSAETMRGETETERMLAVFGYATWPFLPLLAILVPLELAFYGTALFSELRPEPPGFLPPLVTVLELATIGLWLWLMVRGTQWAAALSGVRAAETVALSALEIAVIGVLLVVILFVSFMI